MMKISHEHGFTLVELMVALAISGIVSAAMYSVYIGQQQMNQAQDQIVEIQQNLRAGLDMIFRELRMAGYDPYESAKDISGEYVQFTVADKKKLACTFLTADDGIDNDKDGETDEFDETDDPKEFKELQFVKHVQYDLFDGYDNGIMDLGRQVGTDPASKRVLIENVEDLEFLYTVVDRQGNILGKPKTEINGVQFPDELSNIGVVDISILAKSSGISPNYTHTETYTTASGAVWGPFNDNVRRRMQIVRVQCRNNRRKR